MSYSRSERMVTLVEKFLTILIWLNWLCAAVFSVLLMISFVYADQLTRTAGADGIAFDELALLRMAVAIGLVVVPLAHLALTRLRAIVATVRAGDPFLAANARRLTVIAWALLGIMVCDLAFGVVATTADTRLDWTFSLTGWLAILLLFVLARVFDHGTRMRDEIEGTV